MQPQSHESAIFWEPLCPAGAGPGGGKVQQSPVTRAHGPLLGVVPGAFSQGRMSYDLRRLPLHGLIERCSRARRCRVTDAGVRAALCLTLVAVGRQQPATPACGASSAPQNIANPSRPMPEGTLGVATAGSPRPPFRQTARPLEQTAAFPATPSPSANTPTREPKLVALQPLPQPCCDLKTETEAQTEELVA